MGAGRVGCPPSMGEFSPIPAETGADPCGGPIPLKLRESESETEREKLTRRVGD